MKASISQAEWLVMKVVWQQAPCTLPVILEALGETGCSPTTIQTYLARLVKKGAIRTQKQGKGYLYTPLVTEDECQMEESRRFVDRVFDGSVSRMLAGFLKTQDLCEDEIEELRRILMQGKSKRASR